MGGAGAVLKSEGQPHTASAISCRRGRRGAASPMKNKQVAVPTVMSAIEDAQELGLSPFVNPLYEQPGRITYFVIHAKNNQSHSVF